jgi:hypothetical protein
MTSAPSAKAPARGSGVALLARSLLDDPELEIRQLLRLAYGDPLRLDPLSTLAAESPTPPASSTGPRGWFHEARGREEYPAMGVAPPRKVRLLAAASACAAFAGGAATTPERVSASVVREGFSDAGRAITGAVDADAVVLPDGRLRMYYAIGSGLSGHVTSSISADGRRWTHERTKLPRCVAPDVVRLPDGRFRMYFTSADDPGFGPGQERSIKSAISDDGIDWTIEPGYRLTPDAFPSLVPGGRTQYRVTHSGVVQLPDGTWLMLAEYSIEKGFDPRGVSSKDKTELIVWATSADGLTFEARGIAVDSRRKSTFDGFVGSPDPVIWSDGSVRAFFWSPGPRSTRNQPRYTGLLSTTFTGRGWTKPKSARTSAPFPKAFAGGDGGSDPTSAIFGGRALLFWGRGGEDTGPSHEALDYSVLTSTKRRLTVRRAGGQGTITSGIAGGTAPRADGSTGMTCGSRGCSAKVFAATRLWLYAKPARGYRFAGWSGCNMRRPADYPKPLADIELCWVNVKRNTRVTARFARAAPSFRP